MYTELFKIINQSSKNLKNIFSENHIYDCTKITRYSKLTNENLASLLEFIFIIIIKEMLTHTITYKYNVKVHTFSEDESAIQNLEDVSSQLDEPIDNDITNINTIHKESFITKNKEEVYTLINDILNKIHDHTMYSDKFTHSKISEAIEKKSDIEKESTLRFVQDLDKESRQALKTMISLGIDKWKDISKKTDKDLHFDEKEPEDIDTLLPTEEELDEINHQSALVQLGADHTEEQYQDWLNTENSQLLETQMVQEEAEFMPDDDGDEQGNDDFDGEM